MSSIFFVEKIINLKIAVNFFTQRAWRAEMSLAIHVLFKSITPNKKDNHSINFTKKNKNLY